MLSAGSRRRLLLAFLGLLFLGGSASIGADSPISKEYKLKAAFIYNFAGFVQWPAESFASADSPIVIGVFGTNPFGAELEMAVNGRKINGRKIVVMLVQTAAAARQAHLLFVSAAQDSRLDELIGMLKGIPVLTVGESDSFSRQGGMITFTRKDDKLRFEINLDSAQRAGLKISAQLQKLATEIRK